MHTARANSLHAGTHRHKRYIHTPKHTANNGKRNQSVGPYTLIKELSGKSIGDTNRGSGRLRENSPVLLMYNDGLSQESPEEGQSAHTSEVQSQRQCCISPWLLC